MLTYPIPIVIADDHALLREGFKGSLKKQKKVKLVATAANGIELLEMIRAHHPKVVFADIEMPEMDGIDATKAIKAEFPEVKVIGCSGYDIPSLIVDMVAAGADGYVLKDIEDAELVEAVETVLSGKSYYCAKASEKLLSHLNHSLKKEPERIHFTKRELEVLKLVCLGRSSRQIALTLFISIRTVEKHRGALMKKTGTTNALELCKFAEKNGYGEEEVKG